MTSSESFYVVWLDQWETELEPLSVDNWVKRAPKDTAPIKGVWERLPFSKPLTD